MNADEAAGPIIAVDGPAGAGKSTVARRVADALGFLYLDTGAMYRALALKALATGADLRDEEALVRLLQETDLVLTAEPGGQVRVWMDGQDVTDELRRPAVNAAVSQVAGFGRVREEMVRRQRGLARGGRIVVDGRDIGTNVFPQAPFKFFLTASLETRARRRQQDLARMGYHVDTATLAEEIRHRDALDAARPYGPLRQAPDAVVIDTTDMEVDAVVAEILRVYRQQA
ncbi:MAG: (d)CMP kinase [Firmicutes bacterium]|nr:(d)CMP kinase [Bacillota bacterium]